MLTASRPPLQLPTSPEIVCAKNASTRNVPVWLGSGVTHAPTRNAAPTAETITSQCLRLGPMSTIGAYRNWNNVGTNSSVVNQPIESSSMPARDVRYGITAATNEPITPYGIPDSANSQGCGCEARDA